MSSGTGVAEGEPYLALGGVAGAKEEVDPVSEAVSRWQWEYCLKCTMRAGCGTERLFFLNFLW